MAAVGFSLKRCKEYYQGRSNEKRKKKIEHREQSKTLIEKLEHIDAKLESHRAASTLNRSFKAESVKPDPLLDADSESKELVEFDHQWRLNKIKSHCFEQKKANENLDYNYVSTMCDDPVKDNVNNN